MTFKTNAARLIAALAALMIAGQAQAALTFNLRTGSSITNAQPLIVDTNKCPTEGPTAQYIGGIVTNVGTTATNVTVTLSGMNANVWLAGGETAVRNIGTLGAGESIGLYWFVSYVCTPNATANATISMVSSAGSQAAAIALRVRPAISANAGGNVLSSTLGPGAVVGQTVFFDANYSFGGSGTGDEYFLQPAGSPTFNAACFRLTGSRIMSSTVPAFTAGDIDEMYGVQPFQQGGSGFTISTRYYFQYQCAGVSTVARPYAVQTSGNNNIKYTGNFDGTGSIAINYPGATNPFTVTKTVTPGSSVTGASTVPLVYTVTVNNPSPYASVVDRIVDVLPPGVSYIGLNPGTVTALNSSSLPAAGATGTLNFVGKYNKSYVIPAGGTVTLVYRATRPTFSGSFTNTAQAVFGQATTPTATATYNQTNLQALTVTKASTIISDPTRGTTNPLALPDGIVEYAIGVTNPNSIAMDANSVEVNDGTPPQLRLCTVDIGTAGSGPVTFVDGTPTSNLVWNYAGLSSTTDSLEFSNNGGSTWTYTPVPAGDGCDSAVTNFRAKPSGSLAANGSFTLRARYRIK